MSYAKYSKKGVLKQVVKNPTPKQLKQKEEDAKRPEKNRAYINAEIERRGGCEFCGVILDPKVYQWHHIDDEDPHKKPISQIAGRASTKNLDKEFAKCVLLCPTCHVTFHQDLCCMFEHKQKHIDGTYIEPVVEYEKEFKQTNSIINFL